MRVALVTDAWYPQVYGVVRTLSTVKDELEREGHVFEVIHPDLFPTIPCPTYPDIRLAYWTGDGVKRRIETFGADVFVFPSLTETSGLSVAAFPITGPRDVLGSSGTGVLEHDLRRAALRALYIPRRRCREYAEGFSWHACASLFLSFLHPFERPVSHA